MSTIKTNKQLIEAWAENSISPYRAEVNNLSFEGGKLFSYAVLIALIDDSKEVHFYEKYYSKTTSRHLSMAKRAIAAKQTLLAK